MNVSTASLEIEKIRICDASHCKYRPSTRSDVAGMLKLYDIPDARALATVAPPSSTCFATRVQSSLRSGYAGTTIPCSWGHKINSGSIDIVASSTTSRDAVVFLKWSIACLTEMKNSNWTGHTDSPPTARRCCKRIIIVAKLTDALYVSSTMPATSTLRPVGSVGSDIPDGPDISDELGGSIFDWFILQFESSGNHFRQIRCVRELANVNERRC